jgi:hypothetical protein
MKGLEAARRRHDTLLWFVRLAEKTAAVFGYYLPYAFQFADVEVGEPLSRYRRLKDQFNAVFEDLQHVFRYMHYGGDLFTALFMYLAFSHHGSETEASFCYDEEHDEFVDNVLPGKLLELNEILKPLAAQAPHTLRPLTSVVSSSCFVPVTCAGNEHECRYVMPWWKPEYTNKDHVFFKLDSFWQTWTAEWLAELEYPDYAVDCLAKSVFDHNALGLMLCSKREKCTSSNLMLGDGTLEVRSEMAGPYTTGEMALRCLSMPAGHSCWFERTFQMHFGQEFLQKENSKWFDPCVVVETLQGHEPIGRFIEGCTKAFSGQLIHDTRTCVIRWCQSNWDILQCYLSWGPGEKRYEWSNVSQLRKKRGHVEMVGR